MKFFCTTLFLFIAAVSLRAANPAYTDFRGTNEVLVTTNPATGRIIIGPATPISTQINAAQAWTNDGTTLHPTVITPVVIGNDALVARGTLRVSNTNYNSSTGLLYGDGGTLGLWSGANPSTGGAFTNGEYAALVGFGGGVGFVHYGVIGACEPSLVQGGTNIGVAGIATPFGSSGIYVGGFFAVSADDSFLIPAYENAALIADTLNQGGPIFVARTNNGTFKAFEVDGTKTTNATPFDAGALLGAYNGIATLLHNTATNSLITVGSSPFNFTNTASQTIVLYLDANGATTTAALNGQTIFKSLVAGDHTIILKPSAYTTITYSLATPIMTWTEL